MNYLDINTILLILITAGALALFVALILFLFKLYKMSVQKQEEAIEDRAYKKAKKELETARRRSLEIIKETNSRAQDILQDAEYLSDDSKTLLKRKINELSEEQLRSMDEVSHDLTVKFEQALSDQTKKGVGAIKKVALDLEAQAEKEIDEFKQVLHKETVDSEKRVEEKLSEEYEKMKAEMTKSLQQDANKILYTVTKEVLGKAIDLETHQDLVLEALDKAKTENVFKSNQN